MKTYQSSSFYLSTLCAGAVAVGLSLNASAQNLDGTLSAFYGSPLAVQTINTGFGNSTYSGTPNGPDANGSELDAGYGVMSGGNLDLFLAGDYENNGNHLDVFINSGTPGQNTLNISGGWTASAMNGSVFSPGFYAGTMLDLNDYQGTLYVDQYVLSAGGSVNSYLGGVSLTAGIGNAVLGGMTVALNNSHVSTMGTAGAALSGATSGASTTTGLELQIPLSSLGYTSGSIEVLADINGGGDSYLSDQFLPGLPVGTGNLGNGGVFNFSETPDEYFTVVPEPGTISLLGLSLAGWLSSRRRK